MAAQVERECVGGLYPFLKRDHIGCVPYDLIALVGHELGAHRRVRRHPHQLGDKSQIQTDHRGLAIGTHH